MMTLRSKPKMPYHPHGRLECHNVHFQNLARQKQCLVGAEWILQCQALPDNFAAIARFNLTMAMSRLQTVFRTIRVLP